MIQHILLFKFKEETPSDTIKAIMDKFVECKNKLSGFESIQYGENISSKKHLGKGFNYGVIMNFKSEEDISAYNELEEHKQAQELQKLFLEEVLVFDIKS